MNSEEISQIVQELFHTRQAIMTMTLTDHWVTRAVYLRALSEVHEGRNLFLNVTSALASSQQMD